MPIVLWFEREAEGMYLVLADRLSFAGRRKRRFWSSPIVFWLAGGVEEACLVLADPLMVQREDEEMYLVPADCLLVRRWS